MKKIFDYVDQNFDRMMEEMKEFCSHRSVAGDKTGLEETRNWSDKKLSAVGIPHEFQKVENGNALISASVSGSVSRYLQRISFFPVPAFRSGCCLPYPNVFPESVLFWLSPPGNRCIRLHTVPAVHPLQMP